jgi:hypothetical protein
LVGSTVARAAIMCPGENNDQKFLIVSPARGSWWLFNNDKDAGLIPH